jgi:hypothetical protein
MLVGGFGFLALAASIVCLALFGFLYLIMRYRTFPIKKRGVKAALFDP